MILFNIAKLGQECKLFLHTEKRETSTGVWSRETKGAPHAPGASTDTRPSGAERDPRPVKKSDTEEKESEREGREREGEREQ